MDGEVQLVALQFKSVLFNASTVNGQTKARGKPANPEPVETIEQKVEALESFIVNSKSKWISAASADTNLPKEDVYDAGEDEVSNDGDDDIIQSAGSLHAQENRKNYRIVNALYYKFDSNGQLQQSGSHMTVKGYLGFVNADIIPKLQPFLFIAEVVRRTDKDSKKDCFWINKLIGTTINWINESMVISIFQTELGKTIPWVTNLFSSVNIYLQNASNYISFNTLCSYINRIDEAHPSLNLMSTLKGSSLLFTTLESNPKQLLQFCFPQHWNKIEEMTKTPLIYNKLVLSFSKNISGFFFKERCKEFGLTSPLSVESYTAWFLNTGNAGSLPKSFPTDATLPVITKTLDLYRDIKKHLKNKSYSAFLVNHIPLHFWKKYEVKDSDGALMNIQELDGHPLFKFLVKIKMIIPDTTYFGATIYRTYTNHFIRKTMLEKFSDIANKFQKIPFSPNAKIQPNLTEEQLGALILPSIQPVSVVHGYPGNGKTSVIENLVSLYGADACLLTTQVACMVNSLISRGLSASTTAMVINCRYPNAKFDYIFHVSEFDLLDLASTDDILREAIASVKDQYNKKRILIIDEASNQYDKLLCALLSCLPNLEGIVFVLDPDQILPIGTGQCALDFLKFMDQNKIPTGKLTINHRMMGTSDSKLMQSNDVLMMTGKSNEMVFKDLPYDSLDGMTTLPQGPHLVPYGNQAGLNAHFKKVFTIEPTLRTLCFLNVTCNEINTLCDDLKKKNSQNPHIPKEARFYKGQLITVVDTNYARKRVSTRPKVDSDAITNGEMFYLESIRRLSTEGKQRRWLPEYTKPYATSLTSNNKYEFVFLFGEPNSKGIQKKICVNPGFVNTRDIRSGWAMTVNKSQGTEFLTAVLILPASVEELNSPKYGFIYINHLHVAITRAKGTLIIYGSRDVIEALAARRYDERYTLMAEDLTNTILTAFKWRTNTEAFETKRSELILEIQRFQSGPLSSDSSSSSESVSSKKSSKSKSTKSTKTNIGDIISAKTSNQNKMHNLAHFFEEKDSKPSRKRKRESSSEESSSSSSSSEEIKKKKKKKAKKQESSSSSSSSEESSSEEVPKKKKSKKSKKSKKTRKESSSESSESSDSSSEEVVKKKTKSKRERKQESSSEEEQEERKISKYIDEAEEGSGSEDVHNFSDDVSGEDDDMDSADRMDQEKILIASEDDEASESLLDFIASDSESSGEEEKPKKKLKRKDGSRISSEDDDPMNIELEEILSKPDNYKSKKRNLVKELFSDEESSSSDSDESSVEKPKLKKQRTE